MSLEGKVAIVTGGSRGIGRAIVQCLARAGADISFCYLQNEEAAKTTADSVSALGRKCIAFRTDVTDYDKVQEMVSETAAKLGGIDILVNNAGIVLGNINLGDEDIAGVRKVLDTHIFGSLYFVKAVLPHLRQRRRGDVFFISSVATVDARAGLGAYTIAKAGLEAMAKCLAKEEIKNNIRVNVIAPGTIASDMSLKGWRRYYDLKDMKDLDAIMAFGRTGQPEDVGNLIAFLASEEGGWISAQVICVDGGARGYSVPRLLARG